MENFFYEHLCNTYKYNMQWTFIEHKANFYVKNNLFVKVIAQHKEESCGSSAKLGVKIFFFIFYFITVQCDNNIY